MTTGPFFLTHIFMQDDHGELDKEQPPQSNLLVEPGNRGQGSGHPQLGFDYEVPCTMRPY